jgi:hypothetical protein
MPSKLRLCTLIIFPALLPPGLQPIKITQTTGMDPSCETKPQITSSEVASIIKAMSFFFTCDLKIVQTRHSRYMKDWLIPCYGKQLNPIWFLMIVNKASRLWPNKQMVNKRPNLGFWCCVFLTLRITLMYPTWGCRTWGCKIYLFSLLYK